ncbi:MAG TPA: 3TM-type holin [Methanothrix sp.]|nr:3TM-type holin [Methanothrix sp.]HOL44528.1 3TM-type holin [Methanothrix sp.]
MIGGINIDVGSVLGGIGTLAKDIRSAITGEISPEKKAELEAKALEIEARAAEAENRVKELQSQVLIAEIQGQSWLQKNWRPILMLTIVAIVANNYIFVPYMQLMGLPAVILDLPEKLWNLITLGVGGYIAGRSGEKIVEAWRKK